MSKRDDRELVKDIQESSKKIFLYTRNLSRHKFMRDGKTQDAVIRNFEIIGEATKNISKDFKSKYPDVHWPKLARFSDKLIHHYEGIDYDMVWNIIEESLPDLARQIEKIIFKEKRPKR